MRKTRRKRKTRRRMIKPTTGWCGKKDCKSIYV
jgi:hypothetical protein